MFWRILILLAMSLASSVGLTLAAGMLSEPDDFAVIGGLVLLAGLAVSWYFAITRTSLLNRRSPLLAAILLMAATLGSGCTRVNVGHVGIEVHYAGSDRGADSYPRRTGWVFYNPIGTSVLEYPTYVQTAIWTANPHEGDHPGAADNEELCFNSREGLVICGDISLSYQLNAEKVPHFYVKFRSDDLNAFTHGFLRNVARDAFNEIAAAYPVEDLYGSKKEEFLVKVKARINSQVQPIGVEIQQFGFIGPPRLPKPVVDALNAKIAATQNAIRVENELRTAEAEAKKQVAKAEGEARANQALTQSLTPELLAWRQLEILQQKWNGAFPLYVGGGSGASSPIPLMQLPAK
jgi:regulator of protease activity HflC (stomatin/prohibitin superfamily)